MKGFEEIMILKVSKISVTSLNGNELIGKTKNAGKINLEKLLNLYIP